MRKNFKSSKSFDKNPLNGSQCKVVESMFFIFILFVSLATSEATYCASSDDETINIYPSPRNCSYFIACINNEEYEYECLNAPVFYPGIETRCIEACAAVSTTKKTHSKSTEEFPPDSILFPDTPVRSVICPPTGETLAAIPQSCTEYISCSSGIATKKTCGEGEEFSPSKFICLPKKKSDCPKQKMKPSYHIKCRYDKGEDPVYFPAENCAEFKKCANQQSWKIKCARYAHWNDELKTCDWADSFDCHLTNFS